MTISASCIVSSRSSQKPLVQYASAARGVFPAMPMTSPNVTNVSRHAMTNEFGTQREGCMAGDREYHSSYSRRDWMKDRATLLLLFAALLGTPALVQTKKPGPLTIREQGSFFVGGE